MIDTEMKTATTSTSIAAGAHKPWVERYRPKSLQDVSHQSEVVATLENAVVTGRLPHCLFYGPPGSGKVCAFIVWCVSSSLSSEAEIGWTDLFSNFVCSIY